MVEIAGAWFDEIIQYGENTEHRRTKHLNIFEITERKRIAISNLDLSLKDDFKIPCSFNDFAAEFDKDDHLKSIAWTQFLEATQTQKTLMIGLDKVAFRTEQSSKEGDKNAALVENTRANKSFFILSYGIRQLLLKLEKECYRRLKSVDMPSKSLIGNLDGLTNQLENAAAEENALKEIFTKEDSSTHFNQIIELLYQINRTLGWKDSKDLR